MAENRYKISEMTTRTGLTNIKDAASRLGVTLDAVYKWTKTKPPKISFVEIAGEKFIPELEIERLKRERSNKKG